MNTAISNRSLDVAGRHLEVRADGVRVDGEPVHLAPAPMSVLAALSVNPGHVLSRRQLLGAMPTQHATEHAVEVAVARLRAAIGAELVRTVIKRGYRLAID